MGWLELEMLAATKDRKKSEERAPFIPKRREEKTFEDRSGSWIRA